MTILGIRASCVYVMLNSVGQENTVNERDRVAYVRAALVMQGYQFSEARVMEIAKQFERIESIAATIVDAELPLELDSASVFRP